MEKNSGGTGRSAMAIITFIGLLAIISAIASATTITSDFKCTTTNGETTHYTYLKNGVKDSGYSRGLITGSLTYLKGGVAKVVDHQEYHDGKFDTIQSANASVVHDLTVDFAGQKGESSFNAQGFYTNNRGISASKKIWFVNNTTFKISPSTKISWVDVSYPSNNINVNAHTNMDMKGTYRTDYHASADNSYFVYDDSSGLSNKTGARRIDWEQEGLIKGKLDVTNNLGMESEFIAREGPIEDWLPCICEKSSVLGYPYPAIEPTMGNGSEWPSQGVYDTLDDRSPLEIALGIQPRYNTSGIHPSQNIPSQNIPPQGGEILKLPDATVESFFKTNENKQLADYTINVRDSGLSDLTNVKLVAELPSGFSYVPSSASINDVPQEPLNILTTNGKGLMWPLGNLKAVTGPDGVKTVVLKMNGTENKDGYKNLKVYAIYTTGSKETSTVPVSSSGEVDTEAF